MVKFYAVSLALGVVGLVILILGNNLLDGIGRGEVPELLGGAWSRRIVAGLTGFGMAGMSAEFAPAEISWPVALVVAVLGAVAAVAWAEYSYRSSKEA